METAAASEGSDGEADATYYFLVPWGADEDVREALAGVAPPSLDIEVCVERRAQERRRGADRRGSANGSALNGDADRRAIKGQEGRRVADRRSPLVPAMLPFDLPDEVARLGDSVRWLQRVAPSRNARLDTEAKRLIVAYQAGDEEAFEKLYGLFSRSLRIYLHSLVRNHHDAEDIAQEVVIRLLGALLEFQISGTPFRIFLFRVARNLAINHVAKHNRVQIEEPALLARRMDSNGGLEELGLDEKLDDEKFMRLIEPLSEPQRQVLMLRFMAGLGFTEIAQILSSTPNAIRNLQYRAFKTLKPTLVAEGRNPSISRDEFPMVPLPYRDPVTTSRKLALVWRVA